MTAALAVDDRDALVLEQLRNAFSEWDIGSVDGVLYAHLLTGGPLLTASTLGGLASALLDRLDRPPADEAHRHAPRGPAELTFDGLARAWSLYYDLTIDGYRYKATRFNGHVLPLAETLEKLQSALQADFWRWTSR